MKVISFNIRSGDDPNGHSIDERAPRLKKIIEKYDPDIIGFQEVVPRWYPHVVEDYGEKYEILHKYRNLKTDIEGCSILWKKGMFDLLDHGWFWYSDTPACSSIGPWSREHHYRFCLWVELQESSTGKKFHFFDTHFGGGEENQMKSAEILRTYAERMQVEKMILVGDFNLRETSKTYPMLTDFLVDLNMATTKDRRITGHDYDPNREGLPIDFCFVSPKTIEPISYYRIDDTVDGKFPSDHCGLLLEMNVLERIRLGSAVLPPKGEDLAAHEGVVRKIRSRFAAKGADIAIVHQSDEVMREKISHLYHYVKKEGEVRLALRFAQEGEILWDPSRFELVAKIEGGVVLKKGADGKEITVLAEGEQLLLEGAPLVPASKEQEELVSFAEYILKD